MLILKTRVSDDATVLSEGSEASALSADKLLEFGIRPNFWRALDPSLAWVKLDLGAAKRVATVRGIGLAGLNATFHRNLMRSSLDLDENTAGSPWTATRATTATLTTTENPLRDFSVTELTDDTSNGTHFVRQTWAKPTWSTDSKPTKLLGSVYAQAGTLSNVGVVIGDGATNNARAHFDLTGAGSVGTTSDQGFTGLTTFITRLSAPLDSWYRCSVLAEQQTAGDDNLTLSLYTVNDSGLISYTGTGTGTVLLFGAQLEWQGDDVNGPGELIDTTDGSSGALWRVRLDPDSTNVAGSTPDFDSGLLPFAPRDGDWRHLEHQLGFHWSDSEIPWRYAHVGVYDPDNVDGFLDLGRLAMDYGWPLAINPAPGWISPSKLAPSQRTTSLSGITRPRRLRKRWALGGNIFFFDEAEEQLYRDLLRDVGTGGEAIWVEDHEDLHPEEIVHGGFVSLSGLTHDQGVSSASLAFEEY